MRADVVALNLTEAMDVDLDLEPPEKRDKVVSSILAGRCVHSCKT